MGSANRLGNGGFSQPGAPGTFNQYIVGAQVSWELDVWGRLRSGVAASEASAEAVRLDYEMARLSLASAVADAWFVAIQARQQLAIDQEHLAAEQRTARITGDKVNVGAGNGPLDAELAQANVRLAADAIQRDQQAIEETRRALEVLLGRYPANELEIAAHLPALPGETPAGLPSELLERRPDIVAADRDVAAAFHSTESAKAARLPRVTLSASLGSLIDPTERIWSTGADLLGPLFTGGRLTAEIDIATAQQKQAIAAYVSTAIAAFQEVESALANEQYLERRQDELEQATARMAEASRVGEDRYEAGMLSIVDLNVIRQQDFDSQSLLLQIQTDRLRERLRLYRALGGNFEVPAERTAAVAGS